MMLWIALALAGQSLDQEIEICSRTQDHLPLTLCLSERSFEQADARLNRQWEITYSFVKARRGVTAAQTLRKHQRQWIRQRVTDCEAIAAPTPSTQQGRNYMGCMAKITDEQTALLRVMTGKQ